MRRALALAMTLLVALPLAPLADAGAPARETWSPYDAGVTVNAVAFATRGTTIGAALAPLPSSSGTCTTPGLGCLPGQQAVNTTTPDLVILQTDSGFARAGTGNTGVGGNARPLGRALVAVNRDGHAVASVGLDYKAGGSLPDPENPNAPSTNSLKLYVDTVPAGANFTAGAVTSRSMYLPGEDAVGVLVSDDGTRVAVLTNDAGNMTVHGVAVTPAALQQVFVLPLKGKAVALAGDAALGRLFAAGDLLFGNDTRASVVSIAFDGGRTGASYSEPGNGTAVTALAASPDGAVVAMGTANGRLVLLDGATMGVGAFHQAAATSAAVSRLALSADGQRLALASAGTITTFSLRGLTPFQAWQATQDGAVNALSLNRTGAILVASVNGSAGGVYGYGADSGTPFWSIAGDAREVQVNEAGTEIVYRQGKAVQAQRLERSISLEYPGGLKTGAPRGLKAGGSTVFDMVVRNAGATPERVTFSASQDPFLGLTVDPSAVDVRPGESRHVNVTVTSTPQFTGTHTLTLTAASAGSGLASSVELGLVFQGVANVTFQVNQTDYLVTPGQPTSVLIGVLNNGTTSASVGLRTSQQVSSGPAWALEVDQPSFLVPQGSITTVRVTITPPADTPNGTSDAVTFTLEGPSVADTVVLNFRVNPRLGVDIQAAGRVKFVEPGKVASFNVTILNNGSLTRTFEAIYDVTASAGRPWSVDMSTERFQLAPGATRTVPIRVFAPADAKSEEHVSVLVRARSVPADVNESAVEANLTLFANAVAPTVTPTAPSGNPIPFPTLLAVAACLGLAAAVRRRRAP